MKLVDFDEAARTGTALFGDVRYEADLSLLGDVRVGECVIVHAGFAIERLDEQEAQTRIALFRELASSNEGESATS